MSDHSQEPQRRLSPWRVLLAIFIVATLVVGGIFGVQRWKEERVLADQEPWFAPYVDVTATPAYPFEQLGSDSSKNVVLSFIVSLPSDPCTPSWGGAYTLDQAGASLDLDRRIARVKQQGGNIVVSFGGLKNDELAVKCTDEAKLLQAYKLVVERYEIDTIDLDLEGLGLTDLEAAKRRAKVIAQLQSERRDEGKSLAVWATLPVAPQGLTEDGTNAIAQLLEGGVDMAGLNVMTMDYGQSREEGQSMFRASESAIIEAHRQLGVLYELAGINLNDATLWRKMGATPMIGQNDVVEEVFILYDAKKLNQFAHSRGMGRMSMWSANRDIACGDNYVDIKVVSDSCSGVEQDKHEFSSLLGADIEGSISLNSHVVTTADPKVAQEPDDPATSPYPIWSETTAYLEGTKVVWHHNVYEAKWWTQGDTPDNPVLQSWETPWRLIGPVLEGEEPISQATLPKGTYPQWSGDAAYDTGQRVLFEGVPYQAKWWNKGQSPAAASSNPDNSPWAPMTQEQINKILEEQEKESES